MELIHEPTTYAIFTFSDLLGGLLSDYLHMAVTMKSAERVLEMADFPDEIILKVFASLDLKELLNCGQVSKRFRAISHDEFLWQRIDLSGKSVSAAFIQFILDKGCKHLDLSNTRTLELKYIHHIFNNCVQLTELHLENTNISIKESFIANLPINESFLFFKSLAPQRKKVNIGIEINTFYLGDPDEHIKILVERCNQRKELHLKYYVPITYSIQTRIIEELKNIQYLDTLDLNFYGEKTSFSKLLQLPVMTKLTTLNIRRNKDISRIEVGNLNLKIKELK